MPVYPHLGLDAIDIEPFRHTLELFTSQGYKVVVEMPIMELALPTQATSGICVRVNEDRLNIYVFSEQGAASDYIALKGGMHFNSFIPFIGRKPAAVSGCLVVESDPVIQYDDNSQLSRLPEHQINWSKLVTDTNQLAAG